MVFLVTNTAFTLMRTSLLPASQSEVSRKILCVAQRWHSSKLVGSAPSQLPIPGEPGWTELLNNIERNKLYPPLSPAELERGQQIYKIKAQRENLKEQMATLQKEVDKLTTLDARLKMQPKK
jgi:hypothetical protein